MDYKRELSHINGFLSEFDEVTVESLKWGHNRLMKLKKSLIKLVEVVETSSPTSKSGNIGRNEVEGIDKSVENRELRFESPKNRAFGIDKMGEGYSGNKLCVVHLCDDLFGLKREGSENLINVGSFEYLDGLRKRINGEKIFEPSAEEEDDGKVPPGGFK